MLCFETNIGFVIAIGMLLALFIEFFLPSVIENVALILGSSKQGKDLRAFGDSKSLTANHLNLKQPILKLEFKKSMNLIQL